MSKVYSIPEIQSMLTPVFQTHGVKKATLFGSYAKGTATSNSDIDLLVDSGLKGLSFFGLLNSVVEAINIPVDMIDVSQVEPESLVDQEIRRSGVSIFEG